MSDENTPTIDENDGSDEKQIAIYVRTSTDEQDEGLESQLESCRDAVPEAELYRVEVYRDRGISGAKDEREGLNQLQTAIDEGGVEKVVVSELSRISRNTLTLMEFLEDVFENELGLEVVDGEFPSMESGNPFMKALGRMMAVLAELERDLISMRVERGIRRAMNQGKWVGRPPRGFTTDDDGYLVVDTEEYILVTRALDLIERGASVYKVSKATGIPEQTLHGIYDDEEKRRLYTRMEAEDERVDAALESEDKSELRAESDIAKVWSEVDGLKDDVREIRELVEKAVQYDEEDIEKYE